ncbi:MAG: hypothetical protein WD941_01930 [Opitutus sp.]
MPPIEKPLVYLILGAAGSGRREVLADLIANGLDETDRAAVMFSDNEEAGAADATLAGLSRWTWRDGTIEGTLPPGATHVFFVTDGRRNPVDQTEVFKAWVAAQGGEVARVICVVNSRLAEKNPPLMAWYDACVHFADVVLLNRREGVDNKWMTGFQTHFKKLYYPCLFEFVKEGRVKNPVLVLVPEARRMTHAFDAEEDWIFTNSAGNAIDEQEESGDGEEEIEAQPEEDPYFERRMGGRRIREIPDIAKFLPPIQHEDR